MKYLLSVLGGIGLFATSATPILVENSNQKAINSVEKMNDSLIWWWNGEGSSQSETIKISADSTIMKYYTIKLGTNKNFTNMTFVGGMRINTVWGNTHIDYKKDSIEIGELNSKNNKKITGKLDPSNDWKLTDNIVYNKEKTEFLAKIHIYLRTGFTWYQENGEYYMQFITYYSLKTSNSLSGATSILDLAPLIILN